MHLDITRLKRYNIYTFEIFLKKKWLQAVSLLMSAEYNVSGAVKQTNSLCFYAVKYSYLYLPSQVNVLSKVRYI